MNHYMDFDPHLIKGAQRADAKGGQLAAPRGAAAGGSRSERYTVRRPPQEAGDAAASRGSARGLANRGRGR